MSARFQKNKELLLDAAEALFAEHGYYTVTVRDITRQAKLRVAEVNDAFESKENLFVEVIKRRAIPMNLLRCDALTLVDTKATQQEQLRQILAAFFQPLLRKSQESDGWRCYLRLVPQIMKQKSPILVLVTEFYTPVSELFLRRVCALCPQVPEGTLRAYWHFALMTYFSTFQDDFQIGDLTIDRAPGASSNQKDREVAFQQAEAFVFSAFEALLNQQS